MVLGRKRVRGEQKETEREEEIKVWAAGTSANWPNNIKSSSFTVLTQWAERWRVCSSFTIKAFVVLIKLWGHKLDRFWIAAYSHVAVWLTCEGDSYLRGEEPAGEQWWENGYWESGGHNQLFPVLAAWVVWVGVRQWATPPPGSLWPLQNNTVWMWDEIIRKFSSWIISCEQNIILDLNLTLFYLIFIIWTSATLNKKKKKKSKLSLFLTPNLVFLVLLHNICFGNLGFVKQNLELKGKIVKLQLTLLTTVLTLVELKQTNSVHLFFCKLLSM